jgi:hypothetical protein
VSDRKGGRGVQNARREKGEDKEWDVKFLQWARGSCKLLATYDDEKDYHTILWDVVNATVLAHQRYAC